MSLHRRDGAYASLGVKVLAYLMLTDVSRATGLTPHQIILKMSGNRACWLRFFRIFSRPQTLMPDSLYTLEPLGNLS